MSIYLLNMLLMIVGYAMWGTFRDEEKLKKYFCIQATSQWIIISGFRHISVGADTERYRLMFEEIKKRDWDDLFVEFYLHFKGMVEIKDPGYSIFQKFVQIFITDYQVYLIVVAIIFMVPMGYWIYKYSSNVLFSFIVFSCLFYSFFAITGIRQTLVTAIGVFVGYELLQKKKYIMYYLLLLCLYPIHKSVFALIVFPILYKKRITSKYVICSAIGIMCCWIFKNRWMSFLAGILEYDQYADYYEGAGAKNFTLLFMLILFVAILFKKSILSKFPESVSYYNALIAAACLLPLTYINQSAMRVVQYYSLYLMLILPNMINIIRKEEKKHVSIIGIAGLVFLFIQNNPYYKFFWQ